MNARLIVVSSRLPVQLIRQENKFEIRQSDGGLVSALKSYFEGGNNGYHFTSTVWIGAAEFSEKNWDQFKKTSAANVAFEVEPVFLEKKIYNQYYNGFCNATLWPLFHYFPSFVEFGNESYQSYELVNQLFAEKILAILKPGDILWIHDYQLMLLPNIIRQQQPETTIGFFLHIPFPSFEIFRLLHRPWKEAIIEGLLGADLIGFHTHEYVQHFLKTVQMVKGFDHQFRSVFLPNRIVKVEMFPLGIDFDKFHSAGKQLQVMELKNSIQQNFSGKKIIFSVDRLDYTKGVTHRLAGFEKFLEQNPEWRERVVFILVVVPSRQILSRYNERKKLIEEYIGRINGNYSTLSWQPVIYRYNHLSFHELCAMYGAADIGLITPLRDGMNLVAKEYVACRDQCGVLILSELAGASSELGETILVNPMDKEEVSQAILNALTMPPEVQETKIKSLQKRLQEYTVVDWMDDFLKQLEDIKALQHKQQIKYLNDVSILPVLSGFAQADYKLLLLDYDGTLVPYTKHPEQAVPDLHLIELIKKISADSHTDVTIISGRDNVYLEKWFGHLPVNLISEHGVGIRLKADGWEYFPNMDFRWKSMIRPVLEIFSQRSPGSFIEVKRHSLVWHYRNVDRELGFIRSRELLDNLHHMVHNAPLHIIDGNKVIEVRISGVDMGAITKKLMERRRYDFMLAMGDDKTDEDIFRMLHDRAFTIKIGGGHTAAKYHLTTQADALKLLEQFAETVEMAPL